MRSYYDLNLCGLRDVPTQKHIYTVLANPETDQSDLFIVRLFFFHVSSRFHMKGGVAAYLSAVWLWCSPAN